MANYTSIMLYVSGFENETERITEVNNYVDDGNKFSLIDVNNFENFPDAFPRSLYVGTYKNFNTEVFLSFLSEKVNWEYPQYVQLFIQEEADYTLKVYTDAGRNLVLDSKKETD